MRQFWISLLLLAFTAAGSMLRAKVVGPVTVERKFCSLDSDDCIPDKLEIRFESHDFVFLGGNFGVQVILHTETEGIAGWSYGVRHEPAYLNLISDSVTIDGTDAADAMRFPSFDVTRSVDEGFISAVVLSFLDPTTLEVGRQNTLATARYEIVVAPAGGTEIRFADYEIGANGSPPTGININVKNENRFPSRLIDGIVYGAPPPDPCRDTGDGLTPCERGCLRLCPGLPFHRGDADGNGARNITDGVRILLILFQGETQPFDCADALDSNDDGRINLTDAVHVFRYLFQEGDPPPLPTILCGEDPTLDGLECRESSFSCRP